MENCSILLSHADFYGSPRGFDEILEEPISADLFSMLSGLSFKNEEEPKFRNWALANLRMTREQKARANERVVFSRIGLWTCWKVLLAKSPRLEASQSNPQEMLATLHELLAKTNDAAVEGDEHQYFIKNAIIYSRDDYRFKLYRSQQIFLAADSQMREYVRSFEEAHGLSLECYIYLIFCLINRCHAGRDTDEFRPSTLEDWAIDMRAVSRDTQLPLGELLAVMAAISFTPEEGHKFARDTAMAPNDFTLFRNAPFLRLSETCFLPVEGKLVEELLFDNLFHKIHAACGNDKKFLIDFGGAVENYVQELAREFCATNIKIAYEFIPEFSFSFGKSNLKSPDAMICCSRDSSMLAIEVKSARFLDAIVSTDNSPDAVEKSFTKLRYTPWEQAHTAIQRIVEKKANDKINAISKILFLNVTMNDIPLALREEKVMANGKDISHCFHSFSIHTFELLLFAADRTDGYTLYDILMNAFHRRRQMSAKTFILRFQRQMALQSKFFENLISRILARYSGYLGMDGSV